jgi:DNA-directed RNA polymerase specialized sigma24 family protein
LLVSFVRPSIRPDSNQAWRKIRGSRHLPYHRIARRLGITIDDVELHIDTALRLFQEALDPDP